jgi:S1-C subfamily serine protease
MLLSFLLAVAGTVVSEGGAVPSAERFRPAVVRITASMADPAAQSGFTPFGEASGFIFDRRGYVFTVYSPFKDQATRRLCERFDVVADDGRALGARVWVVDPLVDLLILKLDHDGESPALELPSRAKVGPGDQVVVFAGVRSHGKTVFSGQVFDEGENTLYGSGLADLWIDLQMQLPAHAYGGPLVNERGDVVGITVPGVHPDARQDVDQEEAHALPVFMLTTLAKVAMAHPTFEKPWIGIATQRRDKGGIAVEFVWDGGPAARAGVRVGDVLDSVQGEGLESRRELEQLIEAGGIGGALSLQLDRAGQKVSTRLVIEKRPRWAAP